MGFYPIQNSFLAGELSPKMYGRMDHPLYKHGVQWSENWQHTAQGQARMRRGSNFALLAHQNNEIRLIPFSTQGGDYVLELGAGYVRLLNRTGQVDPVPITGQYIVNNSFLSGLSSWTTDTGARYSTYTPFGSQQYCLMEIHEAPDPDPSIHFFPPANNRVPAMWQAVVVPSGTFTFAWGAGLNSGNGDLIGLRARIGSSSNGTGGVVYDQTASAGQSRSDSVTLTSGTWFIRFDMNPSTISSPNDHHCSVVFPNLTIAPSGSNLLTGCPWTADMLQGLQFVQDQQEGLFLAHRNMAPQKVTYDPSSGALARAAISFSGTPADWTGSNYPGAIEIFQGRLYLGGSPDKPNTLWASESGDYYEFTIPGTITAASPFVATFGTKGTIQWIRGKQQLIVGTDRHENIIVSQTQVVSALDAQLVRESGFGSAYIQAIDVGDQVVFVSKDQTKVRALNFDFDTQAWTAPDITFFADHMCKAGITHIAFSRDPQDMIYAVLASGEMRTCSYDRINKVNAWYRWTTNGTVKAMCALNETNATTVWIVVNRGGTNFIEYIPSFEAETPYFFDAAVYSTPTITTISTVRYARVTVDSSVFPDGTLMQTIVDGTATGLAVVGVNATGKLDIPYPTGTGAFAVVGLAYPRVRMVGLALEGGVMYGTSQGSKKSLTRIYIRMTTTTRPLLNGQRVPVPPETPFDATPMDPQYTTDFFITNLGWDRYARFMLEQDVPLQTDVCAIFADAEVAQL